MKDKTIWIVAGTVSAVLVAGAGAWAAVGFSAASSAKESRDRALAQFKKLVASDPYPREENVAAARDNLEKNAGFSRELSKELAAGAADVDGKGMSPGDFDRLRQEMLGALAKDAPDGEDGKPVVQPGFTFGFSRYDSGLPAVEEDVPRLVKQLGFTDKLVRAIYGAGIIRLEGVGREAFEDGAEAAEPGDKEF
ncbi:MAG: Amuc_1100 family pilus-like protein, partial [Kiritimatiellae bacterium]|nr:Amuc_1100 family pilus-like protein [Kiritimatiellia bacterium]